MSGKYKSFEDEMNEMRNIEKHRREEMQAKNALIPEEVMDEVEAIVNEKFPKDKICFGSCHSIWALEKKLYKERGYEWYSPSEMNPHIMFD